ncbi:MAG: TolC family protein [Deltaproteobacteria bacterium]|jgi:outer membrane protein TolC|nr:TolC family protein [Deltaproteobacteria bacterium]MDL1986852.1 TolC family protein [Deltaproteobacteria bacterium]
MHVKAVKSIIFIHLILLFFTLSIAWGWQGEKAADITGKILTLEDCIRIAIERHPDIRAKIAEAKAGKLRIKQSFSSFLPSLDFSSGYSKSGFDRNSDFTGTDSRDNYTVGFSLSQNIFDFGRSLSNWRMSKDEAEALSYVLNTTGQGTVYRVIEAFYGHLKALKLEKVNQEAFALAEFYLKQIRGFYKAGTRPRIDVARAEVDLSNAKVELIKAKNGVRLSMVGLNNAMGIGIDEPEFYQIKDAPELIKPDYNIDDLFLLACRNRPEFLELNARLMAREQKIKYLKSEFLPSISGRMSYDWKGDSSPLDREWKVGLSLNVPLFSGLDTSYKLKEAVENLKSVKSRIDSLKLQIKKDVEQGILNLKEAQERVIATKSAVKQAKENLRLAEGRYKVGLATIIDLTDARVLFLEANTSLITALYDCKIGEATIKKAVGTIPFRIEK